VLKDLGDLGANINQHREVKLVIYIVIPGLIILILDIISAEFCSLK
jgi:hypothetical protein